MTGYRSAQGRMVDMEVLAKQNEQIRAVGNMGVNARGDLVDSNNNIIQNRNARVADGYNKTVNTVVAKQYKPASSAPETVKPDPIPEPPDLSKEEQELFDELDETDKK